MRKVSRTKFPIPNALMGREVRAAQDDLASHFALPDTERARRRPPLNPKIWSDPSVVRAVSDVFLGKCAYCESQVVPRQDGEVAHHRPTGNASGTSRERDDRASVEHYSWFAYEWQNLFLSCAECNRSKRNIFKVEGPRAPIRCTWDEAEEYEQALLINPCREEPRKHLQFQMDGTVTGINSVGIVTVDTLSLNRSSLVEHRAHKLQRCIHLLERSRSDSSALAQFNDELSDQAPFSGAARIALFGLLKRAAAFYPAFRPTYRTVADEATKFALTATADQWARLTELERSPAPRRPQDISAMFADSVEGWEARELDRPWTAFIRRISIRNFKGVENLDLLVPLGESGDHSSPCVLLLGENSTGKSTTLQAIALTLMNAKLRSKMGVDVEDFLPRIATGWELDGTSVPEVRIEFDDGETVELRIDPLSKKFVAGASSQMLVLAYGARRFFGQSSASRSEASKLKSLFDPFAKIQHPGPWLQQLSDAHFNAVARAMREVLVLREEDRIDRDAEGRLYVQAHGRDTPLERLSDGYRSLMAMVLDVMRDMLDSWGNLEIARGVVLIDEIETHLHPRWKLRVMTALRRAMPRVQFIATTHDPLCLRGMKGEEVQVLVRTESQKIEVLTGLPDVRGLRAEQLLTSDYFGLASTADPDVENALERLAIPDAEFQRTVAQELQPFHWIGDTPIEQIVNEALKRFVAERPTSSQLDRGRVREDAVNDLLGRLKRARAERSQ